ncbi:RNA polymerase factor sigma-54 [Halobacillus litoralis]|uniref:RNA polymerase factor sigma-54 n=1 Tax=Halobacillus litoralis TaxID=45668 RepID=UPI00136DFEE4|nr:RNA polymerase factor sigma-54 [Halobacillus litoralis]MYL36819.1 RNA polymerase factor sigma-54 [Halobacillus litoralis]
MKLELVQKQTTGLFMTTEMRQAVQMLQYTSGELWEYVQREVDENPLLHFSAADSSMPSNRSSGNRIEELTPGNTSWRENVENQIRLMQVSALTKSMLTFLAGHLNDDGFCEATDEETADTFHTTVEAARQARMSMFNLEPEGVGSRDIREYLIFQALQRFPGDEVLPVIIRDHFDDLAYGNWEEIENYTGIQQPEAEEALMRLKQLNPRPPASSLSSAGPSLPPDLILEETTEGCHLHDPYSITKYLGWDQELLELYDTNEETADFFKEDYKRARWLMKSLESRKNTLLKTAEAIVRHQQDFFSGRPLQPLTLKDVAEQVGVHESTVSRAAANKVMQTPKGLYPLKSFFVTGYQNDEGKGYSSSYVKECIIRIIREETKGKPYSDQSISRLLYHQEGLHISRRTVAKYRESLKLPSSTRRKDGTGEPLLLHS